MAGTYTDSRDSTVYTTETYNGVEWFTENFRYLPSIGSGVYVYDYFGTDKSEASLEANYTTYGALYSYAKALELCPAGCRLPDDEDWKRLEIASGMFYNMADFFFYRGTDREGYLMKTETGWFRDGGGDNSTGFGVLPGGSVSGNIHTGLTRVALFWTASDRQKLTATVATGDGNAVLRGFAFDCDGIYRMGYPINSGLSVRYIVE